MIWDVERTLPRIGGIWRMSTACGDLCTTSMHRPWSCSTPIDTVHQETPCAWSHCSWSQSQSCSDSNFSQPPGLAIKIKTGTSLRLGFVLDVLVVLVVPSDSMLPSASSWFFYFSRNLLLFFSFSFRKKSRIFFFFVGVEGFSWFFYFSPGFLLFFPEFHLANIQDVLIFLVGLGGWSWFVYFSAW